MKNVTYLLENFDQKELSVLHKLLNTKENNIQQIEYQLSKILLPVGGYFQQTLSYTEFLKKIASHNNVSLSFKNGNIEAEQNLFTTLFKKEYESKSTAEKEEYLKKMKANGLDKNQIASLTSIATLGAAQASGFGIYLLASSTIGAISSTLGIALPFALYTTMSSAISLIIGPVGFLFAGFALYKSFKKEIFGDYKTATICLNYIAAMRTMIPIKFKNAINQEKNKLSEFETQKEKSTSELNKNNQQIYTSRGEINIRSNQIKELQNQIDVLKNNIQNKTHQISNINLDIEKIQKDNINLIHDLHFNKNASNVINASITKMEEKLQVFLTKTKNQEN
jgi:uncharacterized protein YaaW (UPF0174 family)